MAVAGLVLGMTVPPSRATPPPPTRGPNLAHNLERATSRSDVLVSLNAEASYRPLSWLSAGISYSLLADITDFGFVDGAGTRMDAGFLKHVVLFKADISY